MRKPVFRVSDQSDTSLAVQSQKMAWGLNFQIGSRGLVLSLEGKQRR